MASDQGLHVLPINLYMVELFLIDLEEGNGKLASGKYILGIVLIKNVWTDGGILLSIDIALISSGDVNIPQL